MIKIHVVVDFPEWKKKIRDPKNYFKIKQRKFNTYVTSSKKINEFTVFLTNNLKMKKLNNRFRKVNKPSDVLSFPLNVKLERNNYLFFFKQKTAYEISACLVGSEMCIRDRLLLLLSLLLILLLSLLVLLLLSLLLLLLLSLIHI